MMKKIILATAGMVFAASCFANGLTLNNTTADTIDVTCNGKAGTNLTPGMSFAPPWFLLQGMFGSTTLNCVFTDAQTGAASDATLAIKGQTGAVASYTVAPGISISFNGYTPGPSNFANNISVTISQ